MGLLAPISWGELLDKISILEIKVVKLGSESARANVRRELDALMAIAEEGVRRYPEVAPLRMELRSTNERLWEIEDNLRAKEAQQSFDREFVELARLVYRMNDRRGDLKRQLNLLMKSEFVEEKQYSAYE